MYFVKAHVDGAVKNNGGTGRIGVGCVLQWFTVNSTNNAGSTHKEYSRERYGYGLDVPLATNNLAELEAVKFTYNCIFVRKSSVHLEIYSDSLWAVNAIRGVWKVTHHLGLIEAIRESYSDYASFQIFWTKGHSNNKLNELANDVAQWEAGTWKKKSDPYNIPLY